MPSDEAVKAAREWLAHAHGEGECQISSSDDSLCLAATIDHMMAQARADHDSFILKDLEPMALKSSLSAGLASPYWNALEKQLASLLLEMAEKLKKWDKRHVADLERLAGRGK